MVSAPEHQHPEPAVEPELPGAAGRIWHGLRRRLAPQPLPALRLQHLVLADGDVEPVRAMLQSLGAELGLQLELDSRDGDLVLLDRELARLTSPQLIAAFSEGRPCVTLSRQAPGGLAGPATRCDLKAQLLALPLVQLCLTQARHELPLPDSAFDTLWELETPVALLPPDAQARVQRELQLLQLLARRRGEAQAAPLQASYGQQAHLRLDFRAGLAHADEGGLQALRLQHELPRLVPDTMPRDALVALPLDQALWDLGVAAARLPLLAAPEGWWTVPLLAPEAVAAAAAHTRVPSCLEVLRCLSEGPESPAELRRRVRVSVSDLRRALQPLLLLGLAHWSQHPSSIHPGASAWKSATPDSNPTPQPASSC